LITEGRLQDLTLISTSDYPSIQRYAWHPFSPYQIALSARPNAYFSHATALALHGLTESGATTLYVNQEQTAKVTQRSLLTQEGIDRAFSHDQRISSYTLKYRNFRVVLLSGKNTRRLGVIKVLGPEGIWLLATNVERTLIDVAVRPAYGGGIPDILNAFRRALRVVSVNRLVSILKRVRHTYPYHQAIGFWMERARYPEPALRQLERLGIKFDFYLVMD
jgi:predicted transcriptional regulator of viral defense system